MKHYNIRVIGRVQGVGFRYSAQKMAKTCDVHGFIRNQPDGSVYMEAEGEEPNIALFLEWCARGPGYGRVDRLEKHESGMRGFRDFIIRH